MNLPERPKSYLVRSLVPARFRDRADKLLSFIEAYYEWLEQEGNVRHRISNFSSLLDVDKSINEFFEQFKFELLSLFPSEVEIDKAILAKRAKDFYTSKGTPKASKFFFAAVYDQFAEVVPLQNLQLDTAPRFYTERVARLQLTSGDISGLYDKIVIDPSSPNKRFLVKHATEISLGPFNFIEVVILDEGSPFSPGDTFQVEGDPDTSGTILPVIESFNIINGGVSFLVGNKLEYTNPSDGFGVLIRVSATSQFGTITDLAILDPGVGYTSAPVVSSNFADGTLSNITLNVGTVSTVRRSTGRFNPEVNQIPQINFDYYVKVEDTLGQYVNGETVQQFDQFMNVVFSAVIKEWISEKKTLILDSNVTGKFRPNLNLKGLSSAVSKKPTFSKLVRIDSGDGLVNRQYSYRLRATVPPSLYREAYKKNAHPAGLNFLPEVLLDVKDENGEDLDVQVYSQSNDDPEFPGEDGNPKFREFTVKVSVDDLRQSAEVANLSAVIFVDSITKYKEFYDQFIYDYADVNINSVNFAGHRNRNLQPFSPTFENFIATASVEATTGQDTISFGSFEISESDCIFYVNGKELSSSTSSYSVVDNELVLSSPLIEDSFVVVTKFLKSTLSTESVTVVNGDTTITFSSPIEGSLKILSVGGDHLKEDIDYTVSGNVVSLNSPISTTFAKASIFTVQYPIVESDVAIATQNFRRVTFQNAEFTSTEDILVYVDGQYKTPNVDYTVPRANILQFVDSFQTPSEVFINVVCYEDDEIPNGNIDHLSMIEYSQRWLRSVVSTVLKLDSEFDAIQYINVNSQSNLVHFYENFSTADLVSFSESLEPPEVRSFIGSTGFSQFNNTATIDLPAGYQEGDLLIMHAAYGQNNNYGPPAGWTELGQALSTGTSYRNKIFYKIADGTEGTSVTVTFGEDARKSITIYCIKSGTFDPTVPPEFLVINSGATLGVTTADPDPITTSWGGDNTMYLIMTAQGGGSNVNVNLPYPDNQILKTTTSAQGSSVITQSACTTVSSDPTFDPDQVTFTGPLSYWSVWTIAIKPLDSVIDPNDRLVIYYDERYGGVKTANLYKASADEIIFLGYDKVYIFQTRAEATAFFDDFVNTNGIDGLFDERGSVVAIYSDVDHAGIATFNRLVVDNVSYEIEYIRPL